MVKIVCFLAFPAPRREIYVRKICGFLSGDKTKKKKIEKKQ